jgi:dienelactone hydrolase
VSSNTGSLKVLSPQLLQILRAYWRLARPGHGHSLIKERQDVAATAPRHHRHLHRLRADVGWYPGGVSKPPWSGAGTSDRLSGAAGCRYSGCYSGTFVDQAFDAYAALRYLSTLKVVDAERVALFGQSMGGSATLYAIDRDLAAQYFGQRFRAAIAYYPRCVVVTVPAMTAPVLILIGEADQWNGADACKTLRNLARPDSASIDLTVYPGVHHAFDVAQLKPGRSSAGRWLEFDEPAAHDAEEKTRAFLADNLVSIPETQQPRPR